MHFIIWLLNFVLYSNRIKIKVLKMFAFWMESFSSDPTLSVSQGNQTSSFYSRNMQSKLLWKSDIPLFTGKKMLFDNNK